MRTDKRNIRHGTAQSIGNKVLAGVAAVLIMAGAALIFVSAAENAEAARAAQVDMDEAVAYTQMTVDDAKKTSDDPDSITTMSYEEAIERSQEAQQQEEAQQEQTADQQEQTESDQQEQQADQSSDNKTKIDTTKQHYGTAVGSSKHIDVSEETNGSLSKKTPDQAADTINILGDTIPYVDAYGVSRAPEHGAGVWLGDDLVDDGQMCYFVGHNPGDFHKVMKLKKGDPVTVSDDNGNVKTYIVHNAFVIPQTTYYEDIMDKVEGHGESVVLQTCCGDNVHVRVVVAW